jgi:hypothetical protein
MNEAEAGDIVNLDDGTSGHRTIVRYDTRVWSDVAAATNSQRNAQRGWGLVTAPSGLEMPRVAPLGLSSRARERVHKPNPGPQISHRCISHCED